MVWFQVDDNLAWHQRVIDAGNASMGLWVRAGAWSSANQLGNGRYRTVEADPEDSDYRPPTIDPRQHGRSVAV